MIEAECSLDRIAITIGGKTEITLVTQAKAKDFEELQGKSLNVRITEWRKKRSLTQNAYLWFLIGELGKKIGIGKGEIYKGYVRDCGPYEVIPIKSEAVAKFSKTWEARGLGWICETLRESKLIGYETVIAYYGSSSYDSKEMARMIECVIADCEEQGIQTMPLKDIMLLENENDVEKGGKEE